MPHVTFIHGISNKPPKDDLLRIWRNVLADNGLPLADLGVSSDMVYWADVLNEKPDSDTTAHESLLEQTPAELDAASDMAWPVAANEEEAVFLERLRGSFTSIPLADLDNLDPEEQALSGGIGLERVPLPWPLKKLILKAFLRDAHHYLFDTEFSPRPGVTYSVRKEIRRRFVSMLLEHKEKHPHIVVSHSLGTVIAYDCLKNVPDCPRVDGLITLGCPLGLDEVQDRLSPNWSRADGYPSRTNTDGWANYYDKLDPVCGFDPEIANDFKKGNVACVADIEVKNEGNWRHSATKYLRRDPFLARLRAMLEV